MGTGYRLCPTLLTCKFSQIVEFIDHAECCPNTRWVKLIPIQCEMARIKLYFESGRRFLIPPIYIRMRNEAEYYVAEREK